MSCHLVAKRMVDMTRKFIDCRAYPSDSHCSVEISADREDELIEAATVHAVQAHKHADSPELRRWLQDAVQSREEALT